MAQTRITIRDVAAQAGVSHQTVSRVINNSDRVLPETRARVEAAITALNYRPNALAQSMAKGRSGILACIAPNLTDYTFASLINGAEIEARQHDYFLLSATAHDDDTFTALANQLINSRRAEGMLIINPYTDALHMRLPKNFPHVFATARPNEEQALSVTIDDIVAAEQATRHLLDLGHREIGVITGPLSENCAQDRCFGYEKALLAQGLALEPAWLIEGDWTPKSGYDSMMAFAENGRIPSAIFAQNDLMAVGAMRAARDLGLEIPKDLSVIGIDDIPLAAYFDPPLTTYKQDFLRIGREAARLLIQKLEHPTTPQHNMRLIANMIARRSTAVFQPK